MQACNPAVEKAMDTILMWLCLTGGLLKELSAVQPQRHASKFAVRMTCRLIHPSDFVASR